MADLDTVGILDVGGDGPITAARRAQVTHFSKCSLFCLVLDQRAFLADPPAERPIAAEILPGAPLMALGVADSLTDPLTLELGDRGENGQNELGDAVAGDVATEIEKPQRDPPTLEIADHVERIPGGSEHPVELGGDHNVAGLEHSDKPCSFRSVAERD